MRVLSLLCSLILLVACSSNSSSGASVPESPESSYSKGLPATDLAVADAVDTPGSPPESGYTRQFVLEEEVIASAKEAGSSIVARDSSDFKAPVERMPMPSLDKTYTLQLAAVKEMDQAIAFAQRYQIDSNQAGVARILSKGQLWYVLAYGVYTSKEDANLAKSDLQAKGVPEPWVRTLATLEALSKEASESGF